MIYTLLHGALPTLTTQPFEQIHAASEKDRNTPFSQQNVGAEAMAAI